MLHNSFNLAVWRLPPAPPPATPTSAAAAASAASPAAASASSPAPYSAACPPGTAASCSDPAADPATADFHPHRRGISYHDDHGKQTACTSAGSTAVTDHSDAVLLAFTKPRFRAYSITRSPDGRFVAIGKVAVAGGWAHSMCMCMCMCRCRCMPACLLDDFAVCSVGIKSVIFLATLAYVTRQHSAVSSVVYWLSASHITAAHARLTSFYKLAATPASIVTTGLMHIQHQLTPDQQPMTAWTAKPCQVQIVVNPACRRSCWAAVIV